MEKISDGPEKYPSITMEEPPGITSTRNILKGWEKENCTRPDHPPPGSILLCACIFEVE